jgi:hypothetical protein
MNFSGNYNPRNHLPIQIAQKQALNVVDFIISVGLSNKLLSLIQSSVTAIFMVNENPIPWIGLNDRLHAFVNYFVN